ncbi:MAG: 23S rRNA (uracil(1939)-C(5))-methyltransferase RlmD [Steroidobacterales bacterium]
MAKPVTPAPELTADIVALAHDGRGIARIDGKVVFVAGALPGERVRLLVQRRRRQMDEAALLEILSPSPDRVTPKCAHFGVCGGCSLQHLAPSAQLAAKQGQLLEDLARIGRVVPERVLAPLQGPQWAYRRRARLGVKYVHKKGRVLAGFRERDKPYLADIRCCEVLVESLRTLPGDLAALVETLSIREHMPQVEVAVGDAATALVFRVMRPPAPADIEKLEAFGLRHGVQIFLQSGGPDTVAALHPGAAPLSYRIDAAGVSIEFGPLDFVQVNASINDSMVAAAIAELQAGPDDAVLELFCGLGNFTLPVARGVRQVTGVEGDPGLVARARANAAANGIANAQFAAENLFEPAGWGPWAQGRYACVLLDPPRAGAAAAMLHMSQWAPRRIVYISCHPGSLARDAGILAQSQGYRLIAAGVMDMFAQTTHVESIAIFERPA